MNEPEDPEHRNFVNLIAVIFLILLGIAAVYIVKMMLDSEKLQRCILSGRRDCIAIEAAPSR